VSKARIGIVTAMPTEVWPLVRSWQRQGFEHGGRSFEFFLAPEGDVAVLCGGIGYEAGKRAAEAMLAFAQPRWLVAAGLAGALKPEYRLGETMQPAAVINASTGRRFATQAGKGTVVSSAIIAGVDEKRRLAREFPAADIVDMEGAAIAEVAAQRGVPLLAAKAVSDEFDFELPPLNPFVDAEGGFRAARFTLYAAFRPQWWPVIVALKRHSDRAAEALAGLLRQIIAEDS
jgi:adenosylhomocysteine nucleosidase